MPNHFPEGAPSPASCEDAAAVGRNNVRDTLAARAIPGLGDVGLLRAVREHGSARAVIERQSSAVREAAYRDADRMLAAARTSQADVLCREDDRYPSRLHELHDPPSVLFAKGSLLMAAAPAVAIVGTRGASSYGLRVARAIASACARAGASVISGLAQGIDGAAHEAALEAGGRTTAVLGTGVNVSYPRRHHALQQRIARDGLLLSELEPDQPGHGGAFPRRNRIIAALADVTVVVEAGEQSGALITARCAFDLHRPVLCVPNAIDVPSAKGSNALLKECAEPLLVPDDVLAMLSLRAEPTAAPLLDGDAATCWDAILRGASDVPSVVNLTAMSSRAAAVALSALELEGLVHIDLSGHVRTTIAERSTWTGSSIGARP